MLPPKGELSVELALGMVLDALRGVDMRGEAGVTPQSKLEAAAAVRDVQRGTLQSRADVVAERDALVVELAEFKRKLLPPP